MNQKRSLDYYLLWIITLISLTLNVIVIASLLNARRQAATAFGQAAAVVAQLKQVTFGYNVVIDEEIPIAADVPVNFTVSVPIEQSIPINTIVNVPIEFPIVGQRTITVPISTTIPISLTVDVPIDRTLPIDATVPVSLSVPIRIKVADTAFAETLDDVETILLEMAKEMGAVVKQSP
ncbi:MAG: hypothetical protein FJ030_04280 [Chloroflexi bacterium]|nr:hypothetical protein [Chloroflexota bacterium]